MYVHYDVGGVLVVRQKPNRISSRTARVKYSRVISEDNERTAADVGEIETLCGGLVDVVAM